MLQCSIALKKALFYAKYNLLKSIKFFFYFRVKQIFLYRYLKVMCLISLICSENYDKAICKLIRQKCNSVVQYVFINISTSPKQQSWLNQWTNSES